MADACDIYRGFPPHLVYPSTVDALKKQLASDLLAANMAATTCVTLPSTLLAQWGAFYADAYAWSQTDTSIFGLGSQMDQGQSYQCALYAWQQRLNASSCSVVVRGNPNPEGVGDITPVLKWFGIAIASLAGAYVVGQAVHLGVEAMKLAPKRK